jgi:hypothetical protein
MAVYKTPHSVAAQCRAVVQRSAAARTVRTYLDIAACWLECPAGWTSWERASSRTFCSPVVVCGCRGVCTGAAVANAARRRGGGWQSVALTD